MNNEVRASVKITKRDGVICMETSDPRPDRPVSATYKIGTNKGRPRIWIDGKRLADAGFTGGTYYTCIPTFGKITCQKYFSASLEDAVVWETMQAVVEVDGGRVRKVTGRPDGKPIIDLLGADVEAAFPGGKRVKATFFPGKLVIEREE